MKKNNIIIIVGIVAILLACLFGPSLFKEEETMELENMNLPDEVVIKQYRPGTDELIREASIYSKDEIKKLSDYVYELKPLEEHEMVNLALLQEIEIKYNEFISIGIELDREGYCYYVNKDENISTLSKTPKGLIEWVKDNLGI